MVNFGEQLIVSQYVPWALHYLDYQHLKQVLDDEYKKGAVTSPGGSSGLGNSNKGKSNILKESEATETPTPSPTRPLPPMENLKELYYDLPEGSRESLYNTNLTTSCVDFLVCKSYCASCIHPKEDGA